MAPERQSPPEPADDGGHRAGPGYVSGLHRPVGDVTRPEPDLPHRQQASGRAPRSAKMPRRQRPANAPGRQPSPTIPAGKALGAGLIALLVAMLLNSEQLVRDAERKPFGTGRDMSLAVWEPVSSFASAVGLTLR